MQLNLVRSDHLKTQMIMRFFLVTLLFSAIISTAFIVLSKRGEKQLQSIDMSLAIDRIRHQYLKGEDVGRANRFFHAEKFSHTFPDWIRHLPTGFHKIARDHLIWHVMVVDYPDQRYILLRDYTNFEEERISPFLLCVMIISASLGLSFILIYITTRYAIRPIEELEKRIRQDLQPEYQNQLAINYPKNEIGQLAQAFDEVYDQLNQALQRERLFTADISHELRTPLMVILSSCELLLATAKDWPIKSQQRVAGIQQSAQRILQQLQVYLALARQNPITASTSEHKALSAIAAQVIAENLSFAKNYQISLLLDDAEYTDQDYPANLCYTVMSNLVRNAIEYAGHGSSVTLSLRVDGFCVYDNGVGISEDLQPQMFEAFTGSYQSSHHLGLGLSLVQRICQYLNWQIEFKSYSTQGTSFIIRTK
ncbi:HAMP domain-containing sensor histidine kinase [Acinetobacter sp. MD2(2019)]|uniref:sensor histidine kinase n=1 Tax=Acinetobacter sp. MD2(2019) TaxID=2605273 RepID=UPI002D1EF5F8|nr:HAMP domain-containing sensor histidine kinase [Acinetobacter sp. MD2(2019)]MEB3753641.1 HAMP domain-containing histidine kinase [Acinetobacter sp. MD2(2019)]